jgi:transposase InsO family protein
VRAIILPAIPAVSVAASCRLLEVARATYYRGIKPKAQADLGLRDLVQQVALEWPSYGYRRITAELRRRGQSVNRKHVLRLMREDNLLILRKRRYVHTTNSDHRLPVYPNLVPELSVTKCDQLWVSDITYIRLLREFIYLAVILDAFSRRVIGWALERYLETGLALAALRMALSVRIITPDLVHHSDRGVQYASIDYTNLLKEHQVRISMSRRGNAYDNAQAESFMKTLKYEEVYLREYETMAEARTSISHFLEAVYNQKRLHSSLGYLPPVEFEQLNIQSVSP